MHILSFYSSILQYSVIMQLLQLPSSRVPQPLSNPTCSVNWNPEKNFLMMLKSLLPGKELAFIVEMPILTSNISNHYRFYFISVLLPIPASLRHSLQLLEVMPRPPPQQLPVLVVPPRQQRWCERQPWPPHLNNLKIALYSALNL